MKKSAFFLLWSTSILFFWISCKKENFVTPPEAPIASAGRDTIILVPVDSIVLDGSNSFDRDGSIREYLWSKISGPATISILNHNTAKATVKNMTVGTYFFELKVTDTEGLLAKDTVQVVLDSVAGQYHPPVANAGEDQTIFPPSLKAHLDGSLSSDVDNDITSYLWTIVSGPSSSQLSRPDSVNAELTSLISGEYIIELTVTDNRGLTGKDSVTVIVIPLTDPAPLANAGPDQTVFLPATETLLDGSASADADSNIISYHWQLISAQFNVDIVHPDSARTIVKSLERDVYEFELTVTDLAGQSSKDTVQVTITEDNTVDCGKSRPELLATLTPMGSLSESRTGMAIVSAGNKIFLAGGTSTNDPYGSSRIDIYDVDTKTWTVANLSQARFGITAIANGTKVFFAGGIYGDLFDLNQMYSTVDVYDLANNSWSVIHMSEQGCYMSAAAAGSKVLFTGGGNNGNINNKAEIFDLNTNLWSTVSLTEKKYGVSTVSINNKIYIAGGTNGTHYSKRIDIYNVGAGVWSASNLSEPIAEIAGIGVSNKIYWGGGFSKDWTQSCKVEIRDEIAQTTSFETLAVPGSLKAITNNNRIIFYTPWYLDRFDVLDLNTNQWTVGVLPFPANGLQMISVNNTIYALGTDGTNALTKLWVVEF